MIKVDKSSVALEGTFHQLLVEVTRAVQEIQGKMDEEPKIQELFKHKSVIELVSETMEIYKQMKTSGLRAEDFLKTLSKK